MFDYIYRLFDLVDSKKKTPLSYEGKKNSTSADIILIDLIIVVIMEW